MDNKILNYIVFALEEYKKKYYLNGKEVSNYFKLKNIYKFIFDNYEALHTQSSENLLLDIEQYVN